MTILAHNLVASRTGRAMMAIRDNPTAARSMGINIALYKSLTFGVSALYTGVAGALGAIVVQFVAPDSFTFFLSISLLVGLVVGGVGWIPGAFFGGAFVLFVPNFAEGISKGLSGAVYGVMIIVLIYVLPTGAAGLMRAVSHWLRDRSDPDAKSHQGETMPDVRSQRLADAAWLRQASRATHGIAAARSPRRNTDTGATDTEIKVGNIMPYSGPASAYAVIGKTEAAYLQQGQRRRRHQRPQDQFHLL